MENKLLNGSTFVGFAALLHDLGKLAERARVPELLQDSVRLKSQEALVCPEAWANGRPCGRYTHKHAAWTGLAFDYLEQKGLLPKTIGLETWPFAQGKVDDSLANAAAMHHNPKTFLQWIIATADRLASGFERSEFDEYNKSEDTNHYRARLRTQFEQINLVGNAGGKKLVKGYPLKSLTPMNLFPMELAELENKTDMQAQSEYLELWNGFLAKLELIPKSHRENLPLWLDHFETLWLTISQAIPSATAFNVLPDVSLYDHSKATASMAIALWRFHEELQHDKEQVTKDLKSRSSTHGWDEDKFLLIQGDFFGIQEFVFADGALTQKHAAKLLRGRSFSVSLLCDLAALKILEALDLPSISQIINAAGKFLIVAPNTTNVKEKLEKCREEINNWFLENTFGTSGIGIASCAAAPNDFLSNRFATLMKKLVDKLEEVKLQRFNLCETNIKSQKTIFSSFLKDCGENGICKYTGKFPAKVMVEEYPASWLASEQIKLGKMLVEPDQKIIVTRVDDLMNSYFGYKATFLSTQTLASNYSSPEKVKLLSRCWNLSLQKGINEDLCDGYARRWVNGFVPRWDADISEEWLKGKYKTDTSKPNLGELKTFEELACEDREIPAISNNWVGKMALGVLKGDIDNLGAIFQKGLTKPTFAKWAGLSRQLHFFFAVYLPALCASDIKFKNIYTVFAGGDDFFLIGPWKTIIEFSGRLRKEFGKYVANEGITFSCGISITNPKTPLRSLAEHAEIALEKAKHFYENPNQTKNAISIFDKTIAWAELFELQQEVVELGNWEKYLSSGFIYDLLQIADMAGRHAEGNGTTADGLWASQLAYKAQRVIKKEHLLEILEWLLHNEKKGIRRFKGNYRIALSTYLYQKRES